MTSSRAVLATRWRCATVTWTWRKNWSSEAWPSAEPNPTNPTNPSRPNRPVPPPVPVRRFFSLPIVVAIAVSLALQSVAIVPDDVSGGPIDLETVDVGGSSEWLDSFKETLAASGLALPQARPIEAPQDHSPLDSSTAQNNLKTITNSYS